MVATNFQNFHCLPGNFLGKIHPVLQYGSYRGRNCSALLDVGG